ncbi:MAG: tRNA (cytidine(34)-2'-O)-methyltransferase [Candidatus Aminicenantes bacterium]|nr:tRNA (cytidine(34)-2'-O)-methyltransferase [Candidatus Aminicenantes bacterium]
MKLNVVLFEPEIPQNTGNIARTCAAVGAKLHLIRPLGFSLEDKYLKRAGMDYWKKVDVFCYKNAASFFKAHAGDKCVFITKKAGKTYESIHVDDNPFLVFGKETAGVPEDILEKFRDRCFRIPMRRGIRSLNLATAVAVVIYDVLRKKGFPGLMPVGKTG